MTALTTNQQLVVPVDGDLNAIPTHFGLFAASFENRLVQRYLTAVDRSVRNPTPTEGELSYLIDSNVYEWHDGTSWKTLFSGAAWTPYNPIWGAVSGGAPAIGNGSLSGRYQQIGKTVHFVAQITMGSTTTYAASQWTLSLPVISATATTLRQTIPGRIWDSSPASAWGAQSWILGSGDVMSLEAQGPSNVQALAQGFPITFATGDIVHFQGTYEAA